MFDFLIMTVWCRRWLVCSQSPGLHALAKGAMIARIFSSLYGVCPMHATSLHSLAYRRFARNVSLSMLLLMR
ncbi:hypothetical protein HMPREF9350_01489 [Escherichia coli MS 85-1]|uniref:Uncharacterized protein n=2 Tax=Escherichia coli TaxID=562 RepID=A0AAN3MCQ6_ECOLX|nr:hypothetical protein HMPREF9350_01489 [Escherichia coli MS 85-1]